MVLTILDLPVEVLFYIFTLVYGDIKKNPFFRYNKRNGGRLYPRTYYEQSFFSHALRKNIYMTYEDLSFDSRTEPMLLPTTISGLCLVSSDFNNIANNLWESFYIKYIRKDKPYKRTHPPSFYRKKVYKIMKNYYENVCKVIERDVKYNGTMEMIKNNNASQYLDALEKVIESGDIDDEKKTYRINNLLRYGRDCIPDQTSEENVTDVYSDLNVECMINYRRKAMKEANEHSVIHDIEKKKYDDKKKIADLL
jgi:hypothetical protein